MADNINFDERTGRYSFFSLKEKAWHGLGQIVQEVVKPDEALKLAGLDYEVAIRPAYAYLLPKEAKKVVKMEQGFHCYDKDGNSLGVFKNRMSKMPSTYGIVRTDNDAVLGTVGSRYEVVQNSESIDFIYAVCKSGEVFKKDEVVVQTAGALGKGETIFVTAKLPDIGIGGDEINRYILFTNSHNGSSSLTACFTNIRVVCNNTLNAALKHCSNKMMFRHTASIKSRMEEAAEAMRNAHFYSEHMKELLEKSIKVRVNVEKMRSFVYDMNLDKKQKEHALKFANLNKIPADDKIITTRTKNKILSMMDAIDVGVGQEIHRGTAYWLLNGITTWVNNCNEFKSQEEKLKSINSGTMSKVTQKAFDLVTDLVNMK